MPPATDGDAAAMLQDRRYAVPSDGDDGELELGLSLKVTGTAAGRMECCRILTAEDFAPRGSPISGSSSSVSSSSPVLGGGGVKRCAEPVSPPRGQAVVGWPPVRAFRINSLVNQTKENVKNSTSHSNSSNTKGDAACKNPDKGKRGGPAAAAVLFVKVNMDGDPIGRKVNLSTHLSYESLSVALEDMFHKPPANLPTSNVGRASKLLDGSTEFALTYEDKDGDWMLVGDVPWVMFLSTVKRLRIMKTSAANGLGARFQSDRTNMSIRS